MAALVQSNKGLGTTAITSPAFAGATTAGNLIVLSFASDDYNGTPDAGWTESTGMRQQTFHGGYVWWRISTGETSFQYTIGSAVRSAWVLQEFSGNWTSPYDISNGQFAQSFSASYTTPAIAPTTGNRLLIAAMGGSLTSGNESADMTAWLNSFTHVLSSGQPSGVCTPIGVAYRLVTGDGTTTFSSGATYAVPVDSRSGMIIAFKEAAVATTAGVGGSAELFAPTLGPDWRPRGFQPRLAFSAATIATVSGTLAATETADVAAFAATFEDQGALAVTEAADTAAFTGTISDQGTLAATEGTDAAAFTGNTVVSGTLATTEAADAAAFTATFADQGALATTEATDTAAFSGGGVVSGALAATEAADSAAFAGTVSNQGALAATEQGDVAAFAGDAAGVVSGTLAASEAQDVAAFAGTYVPVASTVGASGRAIHSGRSHAWKPLKPKKRRPEEELEELAEQLRALAASVPKVEAPQFEPLITEFVEQERAYKSVKATISRAKADADYQTLLKRQQDEDDEEAILLLMQ